MMTLAGIQCVVVATCGIAVSAASCQTCLSGKPLHDTPTACPRSFSSSLLHGQWPNHPFSESPSIVPLARTHRPSDNKYTTKSNLIFKRDKNSVRYTKRAGESKSKRATPSCRSARHIVQVVQSSRLHRLELSCQAYLIILTLIIVD